MPAHRNRRFISTLGKWRFLRVGYHKMVVTSEYILGMGPERMRRGTRGTLRPVNVEAMADGNIYRNTIQSDSRPTLGEVAESRPPRATGAPSRTRSHYDRILALLRERGPAGVLSSELYDAPHLFGRSPRNRISELRRDGHLIKTLHAGASV